MKSMSILLPCIALCAFGLFAKTLPPLPAPAFVDGEVSRCYPFDQSGLGSIWIDLSASFTGTASNNLEIAFGTDTNHDGELSLRETDLILGWSCGRYFLERFKACEVYEETNVGTNDIARALGWNSRVRRNGRIVSFALTNECGAAFADILASPPSWIYDTRWNRMRITARGVAIRDALVNFSAASHGVVIVVRYVCVLSHADGSAFGKRALSTRRGKWNTVIFRREVVSTVRAHGRDRPEPRERRAPGRRD